MSQRYPKFYLTVLLYIGKHQNFHLPALQPKALVNMRGLVEFESCYSLQISNYNYNCVNGEENILNVTSYF